MESSGATQTSATKRTRGKACTRGGTQLAVDQWSHSELVGIRVGLEREAEGYANQIEAARAAHAALVTEPGDGAGDDQVDLGSLAFERDQGVSLAANAFEMLDQTRRALDRIRQGTYGICDGCGSQIGKGRLEAAPRATLCLPCKMNQERR